MTSRLRDPGRQLPRVIGIAFVVTAVVYLALAVSMIAVLGPRASTAVPLSDLLRTAVGTAGPPMAAVAAVALTLAATNAYLSGASALLASARTALGPTSPRSSYGLQLAIAAVSVLVLAAVAVGRLTVSELAGIPATLFLRRVPGLHGVGDTGVSWQLAGTGRDVLRRGRGHRRFHRLVAARCRRGRGGCPDR
jgi:amino acid efflux transporter